MDGISIGGRDTVIQGNTVGLNATGTAALANGNSGIRIVSSGINTQVGGSTAGAGNVISGNTAYGIDASASSHTIQGNLIGTGPSGTTDFGNGLSGVRVTGSSSSITIGGTSAAARNVISGNNTFGVRLENGASNITVRGNFIGTAINGTSAVANSQRGIGDPGRHRRVGHREPHRVQRLGRRACGRWHWSLDFSGTSTRINAAPAST